MADIAHTVPTSVAYLDGSEFGLVRPGIQVTPFISGKFLTRDWHGHNVIEYDLTPALFNATTDTLEEWKAFWHHIDGGASAGYIVDPISGTHRDLLCGGLGDASKTTFPIPVLAPTSVTVFVDGVPQVSGYTVHSAANLLTDAQAECSDKSLYTDANTTSADESGVSLDGLSCIKTTPDGGANPIITISTRTIGLSAEKDYAVMASILATKTSDQNYRLVVMWYQTGGGAFISTSTGSNNAIQASDGGVSIAETPTSPALAAEAVIRVARNDFSGTDPFYVDCVAFGPGDCTRWHLPSQCVGLIELDSALASGSRVTCTATGKRVTRVRFEPGTRWSMRSPGHATVRSIRATEWVEF